MKRYAIVVVVAVMVAAGSYAAFARQDGNMPGRRGAMMGRGMMEDGNMPAGRMGERGMMDGRRGMMGRRMGMMRMCDTHRMVAEAMTRQTVVPTSDGGIVVVAGGKLAKYDASLNLVKETDLKVDYNALEQKMDAMMEECPGCKQMSQPQTGGAPSGR
jgi:hypothetical protein